MILFKTPQDWLQCLLRVALGVVIFPHGAQKLLGLFGGNGFAATTGYFSAQLGVPVWLTALVVATEFGGGLLLMVGFLGRVAALALVADMVGAIALVHWKNGFFCTSGGLEYPLLLGVVALVVVVRGSGAFSVDRALAGSPNLGRSPRTQSRFQP
ncbi:DoxX family protein [soil metagenome]